MKNTNVYSLSSSRMQANTNHSHQVQGLPPRIAEITAEGDRKNLRELEKYHKKTEGLAESVNQLDAEIRTKALESEQARARWSHYGNLGSHWTPTHPATMWIVAAFVVLAETVLTSTVMSGLDLPDIERWLIAFGVTLACTFFGIKGGAYGWRSIADDERDQIPVTPLDRHAAWFNVAMVLLILAGQFMARESYAIQSAQAAGLGSGSDGGVSNLIAAGLTLLQAGLYGLVGYFFYKSLPHLRSQSALEQEKVCRKELQSLHISRSKAASRLNSATFQLRATWAANIALVKSMVFEYLAELDRSSDKPAADFVFDERLMQPMPPWVWSVVDPQPSAIQNWLETGPSTPENLVAMAVQRDKMLMGTSYKSECDQSSHSI